MEWQVAGPDYLPMTVADGVEVAGTNSYIDGFYGIASIEYNISQKTGFTQTISGVWGKTGDAGP
jgi:hypothetical protein